MLVQYVGLTDIKCFAPSTAIHLGANRSTPHKWVVIYGDNGLGKSTLLRSIGMALTGQPALNALLPNAEGWVRGKRPFAIISVSFTKGEGDKSAGAPRASTLFCSWRLAGSRAFKEGQLLNPAHSISLIEVHKVNPVPMRGTRTLDKQLDNDAKLFKEYVATEQPKRGWLICGYGSHRRLSGSSSELAERISPDGRAARLATLFHEKAALTSAEAWLRTLHHRASLDKAGPAQRRLDAVTQMINTGLLHGGVALAEITPDGVYFKTPFSPRIVIDDLSDGYRTVLALVLDLLRHVEYCFDIESVLDTRDGHSVITAEGVVLIDEIDAHLHPSWQRIIGAWLHSRFPNMQFIVATHSPLIATRVSDTEGLVIRLVRRKKGKSEVVEAITEEGAIGLTADQKLTGPDFGLSSARDLLADKKAAEIERLRGRVRSKEAKPAERKRLRALEAEYERIAPATPTYAGIERWRKDEERIRRANEEAAREEGTR
jgi:energy-coupling factor transporter ATP-binding protein EcfA2